jgi:hypothetical protein
LADAVDRHGPAGRTTAGGVEVMSRLHALTGAAIRIDTAQT